MQRRLVLDGEDRARRVLAPRRRGGMVHGVTDHRDETAPARATLLAALLACVGVWPLADAGGTGGRAGAEAPKRLAAAPLAAVLTTDCGVDIDDQWALAHLVLSPELALRAIVTTHASSVGFSSAASARTAADVLARVVPNKAAAIRLLPGADAPLERVDAPRPSVGLDLLLSISRDFSDSHRLIVLSTGAATDLASAILKDPSIVNRIVIVAMGFNDWPDGGSEFNIKNDPRAWQVILGSRVPVVVGSAAATKRSLRLTRETAARVMRSHGPTGDYLYRLFDEWLDRHADLAAQVVSPGAWVIWDEVVVAYALGLTRGDAVRRPRLQEDLLFAHPKTADRITWISWIDADRLWRDFAGKMDARSDDVEPARW